MYTIFENVAELPGIVLIKPQAFQDDRGDLFESYNKDTFHQNGIIDEFLQEKNSFSKFNVLRGLHFQKEPAGQNKLVRCTFGRIYDVVIDIRPDSEYFGKWYGVELSAENKYSLYVPRGFAHGFLVLSVEGAGFSYMISGNHFSQGHDSGIAYNDPKVGVQWPIENLEDIILSKKDQSLRHL